MNYVATDRPRGYAVIDTETSGLFDFSKSADAEGQPRLASFAAIRLDADLKEEGWDEYFIKPDGWEMSAEVTKVNGLTTEYLAEVGHPIAKVLDFYSALIKCGYVVVAFNSQFDCKMMRGELRRASKPDMFEETPNICVMRAAVDVCKIPKAKGGGYKFPKLAEACNHFGIVQGGEHSAMVDARAALAIFRKLREIGACPDPAVHYAKNRPEIDLGAVVAVTPERPASEEAIDAPHPVASQAIGANNPPGSIDFASETVLALSAWMGDHPVVLDDNTAKEAHRLIDRAKAAFDEMEAERDRKVRPLNDTVDAINLEYKTLHNSDKKKPGVFDKVLAELKARIAAFITAEEDKRIAAATEAKRKADEAEQMAREAEAKELEALQNASVGEIGVDVAAVTQEADAAFKTFERASRFAAVAARDTTVKVGGGFGRAIGMRTRKVLVLTDVSAAVTAIGVTEKIREAVLSSARDFKSLRGVFPAGVAENEERVL